MSGSPVVLVDGTLLFAIGSLVRSHSSTYGTSVFSSHRGGVISLCAHPTQVHAGSSGATEVLVWEPRTNSVVGRMDGPCSAICFVGQDGSLIVGARMDEARSVALGRWATGELLAVASAGLSPHLGRGFCASGSRSSGGFACWTWGPSSTMGLFRLSDDGRGFIRHSHDIAEALQIKEQGSVSACAGLPSGEWALGTTAGVIVVTDPLGLKAVCKAKAGGLGSPGHHEGSAIHALHHCSGRIASAGSDGRVVLWSCQLLILAVFEVRYEGFFSEAVSVALTRERCYVGTRTDGLFEIDLLAGDLANPLSHPPGFGVDQAHRPGAGKVHPLVPSLGRGPVITADVHPLLPILATVSADNVLRLWDLDTGDCVAASVLKDPESTIPLRPQAVAIAGGQQGILALGFENGFLEFRDLAKLEPSNYLVSEGPKAYMPKLARSQLTNSRGIVALRFPPTRGVCAVARAGGSIELWDTATSPGLAVLVGSFYVTCVPRFVDWDVSENVVRVSDSSATLVTFWEAAEAVILPHDSPLLPHLEWFRPRCPGPRWPTPQDTRGVPIIAADASDAEFRTDMCFLTSAGLAIIGRPSSQGRWQNTEAFVASGLPLEAGFIFFTGGAGAHGRSIVTISPSDGMVVVWSPAEAPGAAQGSSGAAKKARSSAYRPPNVLVSSQGFATPRSPPISHQGGQQQPSTHHQQQNGPVADPGAPAPPAVATPPSFYSPPDRPSSSPAPRNPIPASPVYYKSSPSAPAAAYTSSPAAPAGPASRESQAEDYRYQQHQQLQELQLRRSLEEAEAAAHEAAARARAETERNAMEMRRQQEQLRYEYENRIAEQDRKLRQMQDELAKISQRPAQVVQQVVPEPARPPAASSSPAASSPSSSPQVVKRGGPAIGYIGHYGGGSEDEPEFTFQSRAAAVKDERKFQQSADFMFYGGGAELATTRSEEDWSAWDTNEEKKPSRPTKKANAGAGAGATRGKVAAASGPQPGVYSYSATTYEEPSFSIPAAASTFTARSEENWSLWDVNEEPRPAKSSKKATQAESKFQQQPQQQPHQQQQQYYYAQQPQQPQQQQQQQQYSPPRQNQKHRSLALSSPGYSSPPSAGLPDANTVLWGSSAFSAAPMIPAPLPQGSAGLPSDMVHQHAELEFVYGSSVLPKGGSLLRTASGMLLWSVGCICVVYSPAENLQWHYTEHAGTVEQMALHSHSERESVAATAQGGADPCVAVWRVETLETLVILRTGVPATALCFLNKGKLLSVCSNMESGAAPVTLWNWEAQRVVARDTDARDYGRRGGPLMCVANPKDVDTFLAVSEDAARFFEYDGVATELSSLPLRKFRKPDQNQNQQPTSGDSAGSVVPLEGSTCAWYSIGPPTAIFLGFGDGRVMLFRSGRHVGDVLAHPRASVVDMCSHGAGRLATVGSDGTLRLWTEELKGVLSFSFDTAHGMPAAICSDGVKTLHMLTDRGILLEVLVAGDGKAAPQVRPVFVGHGSAAVTAVAAPARPRSAALGSVFATLAADGLLRVWDAHERRPLAQKVLTDAGTGLPVVGHPTLLAFHPDGSMLAVGSIGESTSFLDPMTLAPVEGSPALAATAVAFSTSGRFVACAGAGSSLFVLEPGDSWASVQQPPADLSHVGGVVAMDWSLDDALLRVAVLPLDSWGEPSVLIFDSASLEELSRHSPRLAAAAWASYRCMPFEPSRIITWGAPHRHSAPAVAAVCSETGLLACGDADGTLAVYPGPWERDPSVETETALGEPRSMCFTGDGKFLLCIAGPEDAGGLEQLRLWEAADRPAKVEPVVPPLDFGAGPGTRSVNPPSTQKKMKKKKRRKQTRAPAKEVKEAKPVDDRPVWVPF